MNCLNVAKRSCLGDSGKWIVKRLTWWWNTGTWWRTSTGDYKCISTKYGAWRRSTRNCKKTTRSLESCAVSWMMIGRKGRSCPGNGRDLAGTLPVLCGRRWYIPAKTERPRNQPGECDERECGAEGDNPHVRWWEEWSRIQELIDSQSSLTNLNGGSATVRDVGMGAVPLARAVLEALITTTAIFTNLQRER